MVLREKRASVKFMLSVTDPPNVSTRKIIKASRAFTEITPLSYSARAPLELVPRPGWWKHLTSSPMKPNVLPTPPRENKTLIVETVESEKEVVVEKARDDRAKLDVVKAMKLPVRRSMWSTRMKAMKLPIPKLTMSTTTNSARLLEPRMMTSTREKAIRFLRYVFQQLMWIKWQRPRTPLQRCTGNCWTSRQCFRRCCTEYSAKNRWARCQRARRNGASNTVGPRTARRDATSGAPEDCISRAVRLELERIRFETQAKRRYWPARALFPNYKREPPRVRIAPLTWWHLLPWSLFWICSSQRMWWRYRFCTWVSVREAFDRCLCTEAQFCSISLLHSESWLSLIPTSLSRAVVVGELIVVGAFYETSSGIVDSSDVVVPSMETSACAQGIGRTAGSPVRRLSAWTRPAVTYSTPVPVIEYISPVSAVYTATVPVNEYAASAPVICRRGRRSRSVVAGSHERGLPIWSKRAELFSDGLRCVHWKKISRQLEEHSTFMSWEEEWAFGLSRCRWWKRDQNWMRIGFASRCAQ